MELLVTADISKALETLRRGIMKTTAEERVRMGQHVRNPHSFSGTLDPWANFTERLIEDVDSLTAEVERVREALRIEDEALEFISWHEDGAHHMSHSDTAAKALKKAHVIFRGKEGGAP